MQIQETTNTTELTISVVTYNSEKWLAAFFRSLREQQFPCERIALRVRDNSSTDATVARLRQLQSEFGAGFACWELQEGGNIGFGAGHNANLAHANTPFFLVTNVDLEFEPDTLGTLLDTAQHDAPDVAAWECRQKPYEHPKHYHPVTGETAWCSSACVLLRTSALRAVGGYEPRLFLYGEDVELSYRLRDRGHRLRYVPQATVWHYSYQDTTQVKPLQFLGSTLANVLIRCRYGTAAEILLGFAMFLGLFLVRPKFPQQRMKLLGQGFKLLKLIPHFLRTRRTSTEPFPIRGWDYAMVREGAFYAYARGGPRQQPLVSVLVRTTPGCGGRLKEALASIAAQTYKPIHLVVVEDGGHTAQGQIDNWRQTDRFAEVSYAPLPKSGRNKAGNAALAAARGQLVCFLDDDDLFYADHLEVLVTAWAEKPELGAVYALAYEVRTEVVSENPWVYRDISHRLIHRQPFNRALLWHHNFMAIQTVLFQRQLYLDHGGFDLGLEILEDWNLWVRYSLRHDFEMIPKVTSLYRVPASADKAIQRQLVLDDYYAKAQARHALLKVEISPPEILQIAEQLSRQLYVVVIPASWARNLILRTPVLKSLYHPCLRFWNLLRRIRSH